MNGDGPPNHHETIWQHQWQWLGGQAGAKGAPGSVGRFVDQLTSADKWARLHAADALGQLGIAAGDAIPALAGALADDYEPVALNAAYALAGMGAPAADALLTTLEQGDKDAKRNAGYGLSALGAPGVPGLIDRLAHSDEQTRGYAAFALGEIGLQGNAAAQAAVEGLGKLATDESEWVRRTMVEALGTLDVADQPAAQEAAVTTLAQSLQDADGQVRFTSALSLTRLGPVAAAAVPALQSALHDENRYVRANAVDALNRIGTPDAQRVLIDYLLGSRWCPSTTPESTF
jgi:HEAT repeat protein